jgi:hypothetical protein
MELTIKDGLSISIGLSPSLFNLVSIVDSLNVRGEWAAVILGPNKKVLVSGGQDGNDGGGIRVV